MQIKKTLYPLLLVLFASILHGQSLLKFDLSHSCSHNGESISTQVYSWDADAQAEELIAQICRSMGLRPHFVVKRASVPNAVAIVKDGQRYILYSQAFMNKISSSNSDWAAKGVLAHEIGHHLNAHTLSEAGSRPETELEADEFSGHVLARLGASLAQAQATVASTSVNGSRTHPPRAARIEAITIGWHRGREEGVIPQQIDTDGDGVIDKEDACPNAFGKRELRGCPDADGDGIPDMNDDCPYEAGIHTRNGCPERKPTDSDGDGIPDISDQCKHAAGEARYQGCPDTDRDGVPDPHDDCPNQFGEAQHKGCPKPSSSIVNSSPCPQCPKEIFVKGGSFRMGNERNDSEGWYDEEPVHEVVLSDYYIGQYEVTNAQYAAFLSAKGNQTEGGATWLDVTDEDCKIEKQGSKYVAKQGYADHPVVEVSWYGATAYAQWLSELTGKNYRLPTEAEWEYAARGGNKSQNYKYAGSNNIDEVAWYRDNSGSKTHSVGGKKANELGLYDMSGNVWEWCSDWYGGYSSSRQTNPKGPSSGSYRVLRGGGWYNFARHCRAADRDVTAPGDAGYGLGFRLAHSL